MRPDGMIGITCTILRTSAMQSVGIGASVGIAIYPDHGKDPKELLVRADEAMYEAKRTGKGRHCLWGTEN